MGKKCHAWTKQRIQKRRSGRRKNKRQKLKKIAKEYVVQQQGATPSHISNLNSDITQQPISDTESALPEILGDNNDCIPISEATPETDSALDTSQTSWTFPESPQPDVTLQARTNSVDSGSKSSISDTCLSFKPSFQDKLRNLPGYAECRAQCK